MNTFTWILLAIFIVLAGVFIALYFYSQRMEKRQNEQRAQLDAMAQPMTMLILDKKKVRLKDSGLPQAVIDQSPKLLRRSKVSVVKAKIGPRVMTLMCDDNIFDSVPVKKEVKAIVSGIYITAVKGLHGATVDTTPKKKKGFLSRITGR